MQKMIPVDKLARPDDHVLLPFGSIRRARVDQGLAPGNATPVRGGFP